ncbi:MULTISPECIES: anticodon nuclease [unclassified Arthrobacter]|uniref:anticodon nuclease n=1 Tax=unclassified Arthrobacter TaxID=235627 RepID=UPI000CFFDA12|nr:MULTISPECIES: anticodon nuclease [unclassified Arthrobacter]PRB41850.1 anticodon nuclease [Arthrobacter sp. MYb51]
MTSHHETMASLADEVLQSLADSRSALIYAPNTIGKTRLAQHLKERDPEGVVLYNSFVEDVFTWDNQRVVLKMNLESELLETIVTQGLDSAIIDSFQAFTSGRIEPRLDFESGEISFGIHKGDDSSTDGIKISRAEESIFVWSVYYSVLSEAIETLCDSPDLRSTSDYDQLTLAVIDDPVSSMDDVRIVSVALALAELIKRASELRLRFVIATHHALFFNVLFNSLRRKKNQAYVLKHELVAGWSLKKQSNDSPFSYHLGIVEDLQSAISANAIERGHFNQFRALLEKTANFLGHPGGWGDLLTGPDAVLLTKVLNLYSHDRFSDLDSSEVAEEYKDALKSEFQEFLKAFRWEAAS